MDRYKDYKYFKGENDNPFEFQTDENYFWGIEKWYYRCGDYKSEHIDVLVEIFDKDFADIKSLFNNTTQWRIACFMIEGAYECGYDFDKYIERIRRYGRSSTTA